MNIDFTHNKNIILIDGKDATYHIKSCYYDNGIYYITYKNGNKEYTFKESSQRVRILPLKAIITPNKDGIMPAIIIKDTEYIDHVNKILNYDDSFFCVFKSKTSIPQKYKQSRNSNIRIIYLTEDIDPSSIILFHNNNPLQNITSIKSYENLYYRVAFKKQPPRMYSCHELQISQNCISTDHNKMLFSYFKEIGTNIGLNYINDEGEGRNILKSHYEKINGISSVSVLYKYFNPDKNLNTYNPPKTIIYPFGINSSQKEAVEKALTSQVSVIQGPPGTGKTQTILNIISNVIMSGKSVAMCAGNNSATKNVAEKLDKSNLAFIYATLGKSDNKKAFLANQKEQMPDLSKWQSIDFDNLSQEITTLTHELTHNFKLNNRIATINTELLDLEAEQIHFMDYYNTLSFDLPFNFIMLNSKQALQLWHEIETYHSSDKQFNIFQKIIFWFRYRKLGGLNLLKHPAFELIAELQKHYYESKLNELIIEKETIDAQLKEYSFDAKLKLLQSMSNDLFHFILSKRYNKDTRQIFTDNNLYFNPGDFVKEFPVVLSTTYSLTSSLNPNFMYDYLIIDESSQVDLATAVLAFSCAKNVVIVGDTKQLPNVIKNEDLLKCNAIKNKYKISEQYDYGKYNLLESVLKNWPNVPQTLLREHYRCHPKIINFCNQKYYNNQLLIMTKDDGRNDVIKLYKTNKGNHARGRMNQRQIDVIKDEVLPNLKEDGFNSIGIIAPYRDQVTELNKQLKDSCELIDTVHKFQGREMDAIIISTVKNENNEFIDNVPMINVAVSRAVNSLTVITSDTFCEGNSNFADLAKYIEYNNFQIIESNVHSVFDLLYAAYDQERKSYLKGTNHISEYDSENIAYTFIENLLNTNGYTNISIAHNFPLRLIIKNDSLLDPQEMKYINHPATHIDLLLFNKMNKKPLLAIEVDGVHFHQKDSQQEIRDRIKNSILDKYSIPLLRLRTDESHEEQRILDCLSNIQDLRFIDNN